jgi:hypothetical protein
VPGIQWRSILRLAALALAAVAAQAQQNPPHLAYVYPAGGQRGTTVEVKVGGQYLTGVNRVYLSGGGAQAVALESTRPMTPMQATQLREKVQELLKQPNDPAAQKQIAELRRQLATFNRGVSPALAETQALRIGIEAGAAPGPRELRLVTPQGLSNPLVFYVGDLPEFIELQSEVRILQAGVDAAEVRAAEEFEPAVTLPVTINGRIVPRAARPTPLTPGRQFTPGDSDRYRFQARKGQRLTIAASARELMPYLADAVPGWFQPALAVLDSDGKELAYADHYLFHPDPALHFEVPKDGEYVIEIRDTLYRGREDFVYRITASEAPFVIAPRGAVPTSAAALPAALEKEPNDSPKTAQKMKLPVVVSGRVDKPGDWEVFAFEGRAGDQIVAEVYARRLGSPLDSELKLTDAAGRQLAFNDDHEDKGAGLITHQADSLISATLPAAGTYYLYLGDAQQQGGPDYDYRLRISAPRPDFDLRVTPSAINSPGGTSVPITVHALRQDGFSGEIALALEGAPRGLVLTGATIPAGQDEVRLTLAVPPMLAQLGEPVSLRLEGRATIQGRTVVHQPVPADDMMQAFDYRHLVPAQDLKLAVARRVVFRTPVRILGEQPVKIPAGGTARLRFQLDLPPNNLFSKVLYELSEPPEGIALSSAPGEAEIVLQCDAKVKPGTKGNLIVNIFGERQVQGMARRIALGVLPAVTFEVIK